MKNTAPSKTGLFSGSGTHQNTPYRGQNGIKSVSVDFGRDVSAVGAAPVHDLALAGLEIYDLKVGPVEVSGPGRNRVPSSMTLGSQPLRKQQLGGGSFGSGRVHSTPSTFRHQ